MTDAPFKEGDIVRLKAGSPLLTVEMPSNDGCVGIVWFVGGVVHRDRLHVSAIELAPAGDPGGATFEWSDWSSYAGKSYQVGH